MATIRLEISYDGAGFRGWAAQPGMRTVQGELEAALETILRDPVSLTVAGRTDAGVHAWRQVASFRTGAEVPAGFARRLNGVGARRPRRAAAEPAAEGFDARRDARSRTYCYRVLRRAAPSPFERGRALWWPRQLDLGAMAECAASLQGSHDFTAFTPARNDHVRFERRLCAPSGSRAPRGSPASGSRPTPSCTTWSGSWSARCSRSAPGGAARPIRVPARGQTPRGCRGNRPCPRPLPRLGGLLAPP